jgi:FdhD protein
MPNLLSHTYPTSQAVTATLVDPAGVREVQQRVAEEIPLALIYGGFSHAVMLATPADLEDFVTGFSFTEGLIETATDIRGLRIHPEDGGFSANVELSARALHNFLAGRRVRNTQGRTSCGLCGVEDIADVHRSLRRVHSIAVPESAVQIAAASLRSHQPLSRSTRAAHAAAWADIEGNIVAVREDIGRHNALDKLIGAALRGAFEPTYGFCLISSRCSFEMAQKAIAAGFPALVSISAPTAYAVRTAQSAGLALYSLAWAGGQLLFSGRRDAGGHVDVNETQAWSHP